MRDRNDTLHTLGRWSIPQRYRPNLRLYFAKAGIQPIPYQLFGILLITSVASTFLLYALLTPTIFSAGLITGLIITTLYFPLSNALFYAIIFGAAAFYMNLRIYRRRKEIEENLTDFLQLVSANLKGGLSFDKALWNAIRPEFGLLADEMATVSKKVMTGYSLQDALQEFSEKYESPTVKRTMNIIMGQIDSGGQISWIIDQVIENLRKTRELKQELSANTLTYVIFISAIVLVIAPLLFALSYNLMNILLDVSGEIIPQIQDARQSGAASQIGIPNVPEINVNMAAFRTFSFLALGIISVFSAMIISIIRRGDILSGVKYIPFFAGISIALYFFFLNSLSGLLGSFG